MSKNSNTNHLDTDIDNYSIDDLLLIFGLNNPTPQELNIVANKMINKMISDDNSEIAIFLQNAKEKLFDELYEVDMEETTTVTNQYPAKKKPSKPLQTVDRNHRIQFFNNSQQTMRQERLEVADSFDVPVAQGYINPNLKSRNKCI